MKRFLILLILFPSAFIFCLAQETPSPVTEQQLENLTDADQAETEDDSYLQLLDQFRKTPIDLNAADENDLEEFKFLSGLQIRNFFIYRKLFGKLLSIYELQAIPSWDIVTIKKLLPFVKIGDKIRFKEELGKRFSGGDHSLLFRYSQVIERSRGFDQTSSGTKYLGSPQKLFFRYRYQYKNQLQYGLVGDKDAGEQFFKGAQDKGFDFYSFHFFARKLGSVEALAIGDFTVNMGQGLIQWQSLAFGKSADITSIKRQSPVLRPYNSAGEFNFHRGAAITLKKGNMEATAFASLRKLSANFVTDTVNKEDFISSFLTSGYHRTESEIEDRNKLRQFAIGGNLSFRTKQFTFGLNAIHFNYSSPVQKRNESYNLYAISGKRWGNFSFDYSYTYRNLHFFGEAASDNHFSKAFVNGILLSVDPKVDVSLLYRNISKKYQSINGNAFTENTFPTNENGLFAGISIRPTTQWRIDAYADIYRFPWLKYLVDAPSHGKDFLLQVSYNPNKQLEIYTRYRNETKEGNEPNNNTVTNNLVMLPKQNWRTQFTYKINSAIVLRNRVELLWYNKNEKNSETGFFSFIDFIYRPQLKPYSGNIRLQYFETNGYNSRIYAYENDVIYYYSIPVFFDKGSRYYININYDLSKKVSLWIKWAQSIYINKTTIGSGLDEIPGSHKSELRILAKVMF